MHVPNHNHYFYFLNIRIIIMGCLFSKMTTKQDYGMFSGGFLAM